MLRSNLFSGNKQDDQDESQGLGLNYDDDFPETDLSAAFAEGEQVADESAFGEQEQKVEGGGNSRTRVLLMVLLLVIASGAGAYYFMGLGGTTPPVPTVPVPAQKTTKSVALPSKPAKKIVAPAKAEPAAKPVTVAVPPPPAKPVAKVAQTKQPVAVAKKEAPPVAKPAAKVVKEEAAPTPVAVPAPQKATVSMSPAPAPVASTKIAEPPNQVIAGVFALDAGSYLLESNRDALVAKIKKLGYKPLVTPVDATLDMTRLRLGTFGKDEVQEALDFARTIEPGAYSAPAGEGYVVYAGTFLKSGNVDRLTQSFLKEGIKVHPEPVQVVRTLNRIRFGSFATKEDATAAARELGQSGLKATVVKFK